MISALKVQALLTHLCEDTKMLKSNQKATIKALKSKALLFNIQYHFLTNYGLVLGNVFLDFFNPGNFALDKSGEFTLYPLVDVVKPLDDFLELVSKFGNLSFDEEKEFVSVVFMVYVRKQGSNF